MFQALLTQLQNPDPAQRTQAIATLGTIRHPRARQALRYVYRDAPTPVDNTVGRVVGSHNPSAAPIQQMYL